MKVERIMPFLVDRCLPVRVATSDGILNDSLLALVERHGAR